MTHPPLTMCNAGQPNAKAAVVIEILQGKTTEVDEARSHGLTMGEIEQWRDDL